MIVLYLELDGQFAILNSTVRVVKRGNMMCILTNANNSCVATSKQSEDGLLLQRVSLRLLVYSADRAPIRQKVPPKQYAQEAYF